MVGSTVFRLIVTPAACACCASTVAIATVPVATAEVTSWTLRFSCPAFFSRLLAWAMSCSRCSEVS